jgi:hypothetical protein
LLLKHIYGLSDEGVCERWVHCVFRKNGTAVSLNRGQRGGAGFWLPGC